MFGKYSGLQCLIAVAQLAGLSDGLSPECCNLHLKIPSVTNSGEGRSSFYNYTDNLSHVHCSFRVTDHCWYQTKQWIGGQGSDFPVASA